MVCKDIKEKYANIFKGLGCLSQPYHIELDPDITPVVNPPRKIPVAIKDCLKVELEDMEKQGVIRKVDSPTDWVNSTVIVEKPNTGKLRICLDPKYLNQAIKREHFQLPTVEEIASRLSGASVFSKLNATHGYWQIPLDEPSQLLTTFSTPFERYCLTRMPFGIKSAQEVSQKRKSQHFDDLEGVATDIDDILIWGSDEREHDRRLEATLQKCEEINLTLNEQKCKFNVKQVSYCGHKFTKDGVKPDDSKIKAIQDMPAPSSKKDVERLLGTVNYLAKFVPNLASITAPIRELLKKDIEFYWAHEQIKAFETLKKSLPDNQVQFSSFFLSKETRDSALRCFKEWS